MIDTMTGTKVVGGLCGTFLVFLLGKWGAEAIYHVDVEAHGEEEHAQAYTIEVAEADTGGDAETEDAGPPFEELFAAADPGAGEGVFRACQACHKVEEGANGVGPSLHGVVGREVDSIAGYSYSGALEQVADVWSPENLNAFLANPKGYAPGTKMSYAGLKDAEDRANLIAWLDTQG